MCKYFRKCSYLPYRYYTQIDPNAFDNLMITSIEFQGLMPSYLTYNLGLGLGARLRVRVELGLRVRVRVKLGLGVRVKS